ncbi:MAG TPA: hypothetical protein VHA75_20295, partial [Rugosimonospora sp.]|nr:hypothetical protein [Rugosimonospora sp.]
GPALVATGTTCSTVLDAQLRLGVQVTNRSTEPVTLFHVTAVLPLGGLRPGTTSWLDCGSPTGQPPDQSAPPGDRTLTVPPGGTAWVTMTFDVLVDCPAPLPVQYQVDYARHGQPDVLDLRGFPDLGDVPYPGCTDAPGG